MADRSSFPAKGGRSIFNVLFEDNHVIAVLKPAGLPVQKDRSGDQSLIDLVKADLKERYKKPGNVFATAVHRIDRPTSGIVLMAKTSKAASRLSRALREGRVTKIYLAVVEGRPPKRLQRLEGWMLKDRKRNTSRMVSKKVKGAKYVCSTYRSIGHFGTHSLLEVQLETGRSHQIRVQLSDIGTPIAGDKRYGSQQAFGHIIGLHAAALRFPHPTLNKEICLCASPPKEWKELFSKELVASAENFCNRLRKMGYGASTLT